MQKLTLLQLVQSILSSMSSDEVNSIGDTTESMQVANIVQATYFNVVNRAGLPDQFELFQLNPFTDATQPVMMTRPDNIAKMEWIKYFNTNPFQGTQFTTQFGAFSHGLNLDLITSNWTTSSTSINTIGTGLKTFTVASNLPAFVGQQVQASNGGTNTMLGTVFSYVGTTLILNVSAIGGAGTFSVWTLQSTVGIGAIPGYQYVTIIPVSQFLDMTSSFNPTDNNVNSFNFRVNEENFLFYYKTDHQPQYCTVLENFYIVFDSFDKSQDSTLQASKTQGYGQLVPTFLMQDNFIPVMDGKQFQLLLNEAKSLAFYELKQMPHQKAEQESKRQWVNVEKTKSLTNKPTYFNQLPNFGRRAGTGGYSGMRDTNDRFFGGYLAG